MPRVRKSISTLDRKRRQRADATLDRRLKIANTKVKLRILKMACDRVVKRNQPQDAPRPRGALNQKL